MQNTTNKESKNTYSLDEALDEAKKNILTTLDLKECPKCAGVMGTKHKLFKKPRWVCIICNYNMEMKQDEQSNTT